MKVSELIERLKQLPQDSDIVIEDADTNWNLEVVDVEFNEKYKFSYISGHYGAIHDSGPGTARRI